MLFVYEYLKRLLKIYLRFSVIIGPIYKLCFEIREGIEETYTSYSFKQ